ncbi:MAG: cytochrome c5 family protein [Betaproteobacteria bacterium]|nr:cytochrome c5 family protein [Betaproteobacteria bacterium]
MSESMSEHESPIKTPKQLIVAVVLAFVVPVLIIALLTKHVGSVSKTGAGSVALTPEAVAERIKPVGRVATAPESGSTAVAAASGPRPIRTGAEVYAAACAGCHAAGVMGAPKFADKGAWSARISKGYDSLLTASLKGKGAMPAQGGGAYSDAEIGKAVAHLANSAGASFAK